VDPALSSFPPRRSSDLTGDFVPPAPAPESYLAHLDGAAAGGRALRIGVLREPLAAETAVDPAAERGLDRAVEVLRGLGYELTGRSEEHTSELQSRFDLV